MGAIDRLSAAERLALIGELWDSLDASDVPVRQSQRDELDRRIALGEGGGVKWETLKARLLKHRA
jgi:putative addiction module component (TIGR02574 family)